MKILPKHILIESLGLWALAFYLAMAVAVVVGLIIWLLGDQEIVLKASWIRWCATIAIVPVALVLCFDRNRTSFATVLKISNPLL